jgi:glucose/arabinose dehydrogenase
MLYLLVFLTIAIITLPQITLSYAVMAGQTTEKNSTMMPPELTSSIINSGPRPSTDNFQLPAGYRIEPLIWNLTLPDAITFDDKGNSFISEAGYAFGGLQPNPRILKIDTTGTLSILTDRFLNSPIGDMKYHDGKLYVSSKGKVSTVDPATGLVTDIISGIPSGGDHPIAQLTFGPDDRLYVAQGSATNSGVVGLDNYLSDLGWLASFPMAHDVPAKNIRLTGQNFETPNVLADGEKNITVTKNNLVRVALDKNNNASSHKSDFGTAAVAGNNYGNISTGGFSAFGNKTSNGQVVKGDVRCSACIISAKPDGTDLKVVAWGLRMDAWSGLGFDDKGNLIVADSGSEERGSRPIRGDHDKIWKIDVSNSSGHDQFYGWPDFFYDGNKNKTMTGVTSKFFVSPVDGNKSHEALITHPKNLILPKVFADPGYAVKPTKIGRCTLGVSNITGLSANPSNQSNLFIGEYGTHAPTTHIFPNSSDIKEYTPGNNGSKILGQKIVILNQSSGQLSDFLSLKKPNPSFRPVDLECSPLGNTLYVVSFAKSEHVTTIPGTNTKLPSSRIWVYPDSGILWKISPVSTTPETGNLANNNKITISQELKVAANSGPPPKTGIFVLQPGYNIKPILWNLKNPGSFAFDNDGNMYIGEVGFAYNGLFLPPRILKVNNETGNVSVFVDRGLDRPLADVTFHNGKLYVSNGGRISTIDKNGIINNIITALPGIGDHYVTQIVFAPDGKRFYFGVGVATNSGIPNVDNGWIKTIPSFHDIPGKNITLTGVNYNSDNFLTAEKNDTANTGAYVPYNQSTFKGEQIKGDVKCTGCILSANADGSDVELIAWGLRHPYGLAFTPDGKLIVSMNGVDERGVRNVANDGDKIYLIDISNSSNYGQYYGWPDYFGNGEPVTEPKFASPLNRQPLQFLISNNLSAVRPFAVVDVGAALTQIDFSKNDSFGYKGQAFIGEYGTLAPQTHLTAIPPEASPGSVMGQLIGQKIIVVDPLTGSIGSFISINTADESFRPTGIKFSPDGKSLFIASVGNNEVRTITPKGGILPFPMGQPWTYPYTGIVWQVTRSK